VAYGNGGPNGYGGVNREHAKGGGRQRWAGAPVADQPPGAKDLGIENERLRFLVETLDAERLVLEARLLTLREILQARCDEAETLRRRLEESSASSASVP
jgi:hypothetical protein